MTQDQLMETVLHAVATAMKEFVPASIQPLTDRLATLESRLELVEGRGYEGVFDETREYTKGQFVTFKVSMWHCNRSTRQRPGDGGPDWQLAVKCGRDGKDAPR